MHIFAEKYLFSLSQGNSGEKIEGQRIQRMIWEATREALSQLALYETSGCLVTLDCCWPSNTGVVEGQPILWITKIL